MTLQIDTVLVNSENSGNVGAIARLVLNFKLGKLVVVDPVCDISEEDAFRRAKHARPILASVKKMSFAQVRKKYTTLVGTTARLGNDYNLLRTPFTPRQLAQALPKQGSVAIVFGPEGHGLTNEHLSMCDLTLSIPASKQHPTLNVSHACAIVLYELAQVADQDDRFKKYPLASDVEKKVILKNVDQILSTATHMTPMQKKTQQVLWQRLLGKSFLTKREAFALIGFLKHGLQTGKVKK